MKNKQALVLGILLAGASSIAVAGSWNTNADNVVLNGYDVISYRSLDKAVRGSAKFASTYDGVQFHFSSAENKAKFDSDPVKFAPKYNAYCAFAAAYHNAKVPANADTFKLYNGELLVFFNDMHEGQKVNTKVPWNGNEAAFYQQANTNWKSLVTN